MEELEMKKMIEQRKREKEEERQARLRVKQLIEADKLARKGKQADANQLPVENVPVPVTAPAPVTNVAPKDYTQTKIQVELFVNFCFSTWRIVFL